MTAPAAPLPRPDLPNLEDFQTDLAAIHGKAARTAATYADHARYYIDWLTDNRPDIPILDATSEDLSAYLRHLYRVDLSTTHRRLAVFAARWLYHWLCRNRDIEINPARQVKVPVQDKPTTDYYTPAQLDALLANALTAATGFDAAGQTDKALRARFDHALLVTLRYTGIRLDELTHLRIDGVDLDACELHVRRGKGGKERRTPIAPPLVRILRNYLATTRPDCPDSDWLFANPSGQLGTAVYGRTADRAVFDVVRKHATAAGLPGKHHPHRIRHGLATEMIRRKADPTTVQKMLGHSDLATTARYLHLDGAWLATTIDELFPDDHAPGGALAA
jgi:integrase/recombinase XerD